MKIKHFFILPFEKSIFYNLITYWIFRYSNMRNFEIPEYQSFCIWSFQILYSTQKVVYRFWYWPGSGRARSLSHSLKKFDAVRNWNNYDYNALTSYTRFVVGNIACLKTEKRIFHVYTENMLPFGSVTRYRYAT